MNPVALYAAVPPMTPYSWGTVNILAFDGIMIGFLFMFYFTAHSFTKNERFVRKHAGPKENIRYLDIRRTTYLILLFFVVHPMFWSGIFYESNLAWAMGKPLFVSLLCLPCVLVHMYFLWVNSSTVTKTPASPST